MSITKILAVACVLAWGALFTKVELDIRSMRKLVAEMNLELDRCRVSREPETMWISNVVVFTTNYPPSFIKLRPIKNR